MPAAYIRRRAYELAREEVRGLVGNVEAVHVEHIEEVPVDVIGPALEENAGRNDDAVMENVIGAPDPDLSANSDSVENEQTSGSDSENDSAINNGDHSDSDASIAGELQDEDPEDQAGGDSDDDYGNVNFEDDNLTVQLAKWSCSHGITLEATTSLLGILRPLHPELPKTAEALRQTSKRKYAVKDLNNGQYSHLGFGSLFRSIDPTRLDCIKVEMGCDGFPVFKSTGTECWPLLAKCTQAGVHTPAVVGVFYGVGKPAPLRIFLEDLMNDIRNYTANGVLIRNRRLPFSVKYFVCDAVARAYIRCVMGATSHHGCERCEQEGYTIDHVCVFGTVSGRLRTDQSFRDQRDADHHDGISPLLDINIDMVSQFPLDPMHLVDLGVLRRFMEFTLGRGNVNARMGPTQRAL